MQEFSSKKSPIKEKIIEYLDSKGISHYAFYQKTGLSKGTLSNSSGLTEDGIAKFLSYYKEVSPIWLLTGEGPMLLEKEQEMILNDPSPTYELNTLHKLNVDDEIACLKKEIQMLEQIVSLQKKVIDNYEQCHEVSAKSS